VSELEFLRNKWALATLVMLCWAIIASSALGYYYYQYEDLVARIGGVPVPVNLGIDYANGTRQWFNGTKGAALYDTMLQARWDVEVTSFGVMGLYVNSINGVEESAEEFEYWGWWTWTDYGWSHGGSACNKYIVTAGEIIMWYYSHADPTTWELTPPP
jgi:hypothetical protein